MMNNQRATVQRNRCTRRCMQINDVAPLYGMRKVTAFQWFITNCAVALTVVRRMGEGVTPVGGTLHRCTLHPAGAFAHG